MVYVTAWLIRGWLVAVILIDAVSAQVPQHRWWYFGFGAGLDMAADPPAPLSNGALSTDEGVSSIADAQGQLLFYTNGVTIWDRTHAPMPNGTGLTGHTSSSQSVLIVPDPGDQQRYYVFTTPSTAGMFSGPTALAYALVDMTANNGLGDVVQGSQPLMGPVPEKLAATRHANGRDVWVLVHGWGNATYHAFLVTCSGVLGPVSTVVGRVIGPDEAGSPVPALGCMQFSAQGDRLATTWAWMTSDLQTTSLLDILAFDRSTGALTLIEEVTHASPGADLRGYGVSFSPSGERLYLGQYGLLNGMGASRILQYDLTAPDIASSEVLVAGPVSDAFGTLQRAPDGSIYAARLNGALHLSRIVSPDALGAACGFVDNAVTLTAPSTWGLPNHWDSYPRPVPPQLALSDTTVCEGDIVVLDASITHPLIASSYQWSTGATTPAITVGESGTYSVQVVLGCDTLLASAQVVIGGIRLDLGADRALCAGDSMTLAVPAEAAASWWSDGGAGPVRKFPAGTWSLTVSDSAGCITTDTVAFVEVDCACTVWVPNTITPNGDGINDVFQPIQRCALRHYSLSIFDRWGRLAWRSDDPEELWDGAAAQEDAVDAFYTWQLDLRWYDGTAERSSLRRGQVNVLR